jgi:hypothetical protein
MSVIGRFYREHLKLYFASLLGGALLLQRGGEYARLYQMQFHEA